MSAVTLDAPAPPDTHAPSAPAASPAPSPLLAPRQSIWPWALLTLAGLAYMVWAGSSYDPRNMALWFIIPQRDAHGKAESWAGWISLAPGLGHLLAAWALTFAGLTMLAWRARAQEFQQTPIWRAVIIGFIAIMALDVRLAVLRTWLPLVLDPHLIAARVYAPPAAGRGLSILADMLTLAVLCLALHAHRRNPWLAALFAFHPLAIIESAANGSRISWLLPLLAAVALGWRLHKWLRELLLISAAAACTWWLAHIALAAGRPFDGLFSEILASLGIDGRPAAITLILIEALLQTLVVTLALRRRWSLARSLATILLTWALVSPTVTPAVLLPLTVLAALDTPRASWLLSATVLLTYLMLALHTRSTPWSAPTWLTFLMMIPPLVLAAEEWITT